MRDLIRELREGYKRPDVPGEYYPRCSNYIAAALGVCVPTKLATVFELLPALRAHGWDFEVLPGKEGSWGTVRQFVKKNPRGIWALNTKKHVILVKNGKVYDYEGRGADGRRIKMVFRLSR